MTTDSVLPTVMLPDDVSMPLVGLGTAGLQDHECVRAVGWALEHGYRLFDTATMYFNEQEVGGGISGSGIAREEVFLTTKLPPEHAGREWQTLHESLDALAVDYLDLWLIHWPPAGTAGVDAWRVLIRAKTEGLVRAIGVSNYSLEEIDTLIEETGVIPAVNQVKWSPLLFDQAFLDGMRERGVVLEGYSPLRGGSLTASSVRDLATKHGVTPAQVVVRWHTQHGVVAIPRSSRRERIAANADIGGFALSADEMALLDALSG